MARVHVYTLLLLAGCRGDSDIVLGWALSDGRVGFDYEEWLGEGEVEGDWQLSGELPPGLELGSDGWLTGTPEASGDWAFDAELHDDRGLLTSGSYSLHVPTLALLSGFEPFGGGETNPSIEALWPLQEELLSTLDLRVVELPVVWDEAWELLLDEIDALNPDIVIATGQAGSDRMRFEVNAVNEEYSTDNDGVTRNGEEVVEGGPDALPDRLPEDVMSVAMEHAGYATSISDDAGTYLCNHVFYHLMYHAEYEAERDDLVAGFIHVSPAGQYSSYGVEDITAAHRVGLEALAGWYEAGALLRAPATVTERAAPVYFPQGARP